MKLIAQGAEAKVYLEDDKIVKQRFSKRYREGELDEYLRKTRTKKEAKLFSEARRLGINVPKIYEVKPFEIEMEFIVGEKLKDVLNKKNYQLLCKKLGEAVSKMHQADIIHGDLTTLNMIVKNGELYFIDFGLGMETPSLEQKAADILTLYHTFNSIHQGLDCWKYFISGYKNKETGKILDVFDRMLKRRRYICE